MSCSKKYLKRFSGNYSPVASLLVSDAEGGASSGTYR